MNLNPANQLSLYGHRSEFCNFIDLYKNKKLPNKILLSGEKGVGKSTQIDKLHNYLIDSGFTSSVIREPGSTPFGDNYDRPIVILNTMRINSIHIINKFFCSFNTNLFHQGRLDYSIKHIRKFFFSF